MRLKGKKREMKTKKSSLSRLLAALLMIVTVFSSTLIFATAEGTEPTQATSEETSPDVYVYAADREALLEKSPIQKWSIDEDASTKYQIWHAEDPNTDGRTAEYHFIDLTGLDTDGKDEYYIDLTVTLLMSNAA